MKELVENCDFENREEVIIRDIFITNILDDDIQLELLRDNVDPERALSIAVNMELGHQNQQRISSNNNNNNSVQSMLYNLSIDFAARKDAEINQAELYSIEQRLASIEVVVKLGLQHIVRFACSG